MKTYEVDKINPDFTNLDFAKQFFPKARYESDDSYNLGNGYTISWETDEKFYVQHTHLDWEVGYVTSDDLFCGDFGQCIEFIKKETGHDIEIGEFENEKFYSN